MSEFIVPALAAMTTECRSLLEMTIHKDLQKHGVAHEYEVRSIRYTDPKTGKRHVYAPDFSFPESNIIIEAKGYFNPEDRRKHRLLKEQHPELDFRFVFQKAQNRLRRQSRGTYGSWCRRYRFKFADGHVPDEWLREIASAQEAPHQGPKEETQSEPREPYGAVLNYR